MKRPLSVKFMGGMLALCVQASLLATGIPWGIAWAQDGMPEPGVHSAPNTMLATKPDTKPPTEAGKNAPRGPLEEVVVHATRIPSTWGRMAMAVGRVDQDEIQRGRQQLALDESLVNIPGVFAQNRYNFAQDLRISIRGFGARANFGIRGIKLYADDIPLTNPDGQGNVDSIDLGSAQSIEVIRGAVSAAYGAAGGGAILIRSEDGPETPFVSGRVSVGDDGYLMARAKAGGQAGRLNWLVSASESELDGYRRQSQFERGLLNGKMRMDFDDSSSLTLVFNAVDSPVLQDPGALTAAEVAADPRQAAPRNVLFKADESFDQQKLGLSWRKTLNESHALLLRAYGLQRDFLNRLAFDINANGQGGSVDLDRKIAGAGAQWYWDTALSNGRQNRFVFGFDIDEQRDFRQRFVNEQGERGELTTAQDEDVGSAGVFFENTWDISPRLALSTGARFDDMSYEVTDRTGAGGSGKADFQQFSPMVGLNWSQSLALNVYGNLSTSFDPPAITELANPSGPTGFNQDLGPQTATNYELGLKGLVQDRIRYELAVFHIAVEDEIVPFELSGSGQSFFRNAGESTHDGLEAGLTIEFLPGLQARAAYTYSDFTFDSLQELSGQVLDGNQIPGVPEHQFHLDLTWRHDSGLYAGWDALYVGSFYADNANRVKTEDYIVSSLRAGYRLSGERWQFEPFFGVNNLFDEAYLSNVRINATFGRYYEPAPGINLYGGVELRFGF